MSIRHGSLIKLNMAVCPNPRYGERFGLRSVPTILVLIMRVIVTEEPEEWLAKPWIFLITRTMAVDLLDANVVIYISKSLSMCNSCCTTTLPVKYRREHSEVFSVIS